MTDWAPYIAATTGRDPSARCLGAIERFDVPGRAADLGFGAGNETLSLLERGWRVHAVDADPAAHKELLDRVGPAQRRRLTTERTHLADATLPKCELVYAGSSLCFVPEEDQPRLWSAIARAVVPGGWFVGSLLGERDGWVGGEEPAVTTHDRQDIERLLVDFTLVELTESEYDGKTMRGPKHWHSWEIAAQRRP
ncbi:class I SAM-dependent methyltransferase [Stackebrandtia soli]|uniref:class I SAM-dependent methyltransferase n=1 Tax=Stackebrandtia soli TaxID=1892856 RepID=UPI0039EAAC7D